MRSFPHFIKGTLLLTCAGLLCRFSGFFYKIFLAHALGAEGIGIYQLIFPAFAVCHACTASGIESAISRFTAGAMEKERSYALKAGLFLSLSASVLVCVLLWNRAEFVADKLLCESRCVTPLRILAPVIPLSALHGCLQGYYLGQKKASLPAISQIMEQAARIGSVILLYRIFIQEGRAITPSLAVLGLLFGEAASALFMLHFTVSEERSALPLSALRIQCRKILSMALPLTGSRLSLTLLQSAEAVLIPVSLQTSGLSVSESLSLYGILTGMSLSFLMFPNAVTSSLSAMLLPAISEEQSRGNEQRISLSIEYTILFGLLMGIFCMGIFLFFGNELGTVVFHEPLAGSFLCTLAWICPFLYLTGNINSILHGLGKTGITFVNQLAAVLVRILALLLFVPRFGIEGVLWSILISQLLLCMSGLLAVSRHIHPTIGLDAYILKPATAMLLSTGGIYLLKPLSHCTVFRSLSAFLILAGNLCLCTILYILLLLSFGIWKLFTSAREFFYLQSQ